MFGDVKLSGFAAFFSLHCVNYHYGAQETDYLPHRRERQQCFGLWTLYALLAQICMGQVNKNTAGYFKYYMQCHQIIIKWCNMLLASRRYLQMFAETGSEAVCLLFFLPTLSEGVSSCPL